MVDDQLQAQLGPCRQRWEGGPKGSVQPVRGPEGDPPQRPASNCWGACPCGSGSRYKQLRSTLPAAGRWPCPGSTPTHCTSSLPPSEVRPPVPPSQDGTQLLAAVPGLDKVVNVTSITAAASIDSSDATPGKVPTWPPQGPPGQKVPMLPVIVLAIWPI